MWNGVELPRGCSSGLDAASPSVAIVKNMSLERHLFVSRRHRASFRATVISSGYRDPVDLENLAFAQF